MIKKIIKKILGKQEEVDLAELEKTTAGVTAFEQDAEDESPASQIPVPKSGPRDDEAQGED